MIFSDHTLAAVRDGFLPAAVASAAVFKTQTMANTFPFGSIMASWCWVCVELEIVYDQVTVPSQETFSIIPPKPPPLIVVLFTRPVLNKVPSSSK